MEGGMIRRRPSPEESGVRVEGGMIKPMGSDPKTRSPMGGRGVKGSQQAKDYMAKLRAMRKKK
jgi:hypothetical protein